MVYPADEETFDPRVSPEWVKQGHLNSIQSLLKRIQDFLGYGGRLHDETGLVIPVGSIMAYGGLTAPSGFLLCDGMQYDGNEQSWNDLYNAIGKKYGGGIQSRFNVPDLRGCFLRGNSKTAWVRFNPGQVYPALDRIHAPTNKFNRTAFPIRFVTIHTLPAPFLINTTYYTIVIEGGFLSFAATRADAIAGNQIDITSSGVGSSDIYPYIEEDKDSRLKLTEGGVSGDNLGSYQPDEFKSHTHVYGVISAGAIISSGANYGQIAGDTQATGGVETRPRNVNVNYIIKR